MFTGIVSAIGTVVSRASREGGLDITIAGPWHDLELGESIAVRGACLTVAQVDGSRFGVHVVAPSLERTCLGELAVGDRVNLERALRVGDRMGGHWVQGHVDGVGTVTAVESDGSVRLISVELPTEVAAVTIPLGSIAVDGVSLTVNALMTPQVTRLAIVPHTLEHTTLGDLKVGDRVQLEGDLVGKHVRALADPWAATKSTS